MRAKNARMVLLLSVVMLTLVAVGFGPRRASADHATPWADSTGVGSFVDGTNGYGYAIPNPLAVDPASRTDDQHKETCLSGSCPILHYGSYTYWTYDFYDNREAIDIVAYDANGNVAGTWYQPGIRYVTGITVDTGMETVSFTGQSSTIVLSWDLLHLDEVGPPPPSAHGICPLFDTDRPFKAGSTLPVKLQLCDDGINVSSAYIVVNATSFYQASGAADGAVQDSGNANPDNNFRFDPSLGGYIYNLSTKGLAPGTYVMTFTVDGVADDTYFIEMELR